MLIKQIGAKNMILLKDILEENGIIEILKKHNLNIDDAFCFSNNELKKLFGNGYTEIRDLLKDLRKNKDITGRIEKIKKRLNFTLDVFFDDNPYTNIGEHLRNKQKEAVLDTLEFIFDSKVDTGYLHFAPSTGKTIMYCDIVRNILHKSPNSKILIVVPDTESLKRSLDEFNKLGIKSSSTLGTESLSSNIVILMNKALIQYIDDSQIDRNQFDLMICDDIHNGTLGDKIQKIISEFQCKKIGFTSSPELKDKEVWRYFKEKISEYFIDEAILNKDLPQINTDINFSMPFNLSTKNTEFGDYSESVLSTLDVREIFPQVLETLKTGRNLEGKQIVIFLPSINRSKELSEYLNKNGIKSAHIDGSTSNRYSIQEKFEQKQIQIICNCDVLRNSQNSNVIDGVIVLRPTLSPAVYISMVGVALHGKDVLEDNTEVVKKEIYVCDIVNSEHKIKNRPHIKRETSLGNGIRGRYFFGNKNIINLNTNSDISEILLYYDVDCSLLEENIHLVWQKFAQTYNLDIEDFFKILNNDNKSLINRSETIKLEFFLGIRYVNYFKEKSREFDITFRTFTKILNLYRSGTIKQIYFSNMEVIEAINKCKNEEDKLIVLKNIIKGIGVLKEIGSDGIIKGTLGYAQIDLNTGEIKFNTGNLGIGGMRYISSGRLIALITGTKGQVIINFNTKQIIKAEDLLIGEIKVIYDNGIIQGTRCLEKINLETGELLSTTGDLGIGEIKVIYDDGIIQGTRGLAKINLETGELLSTTGDLGIGEIKDFFDDGIIQGTRGLAKINLETGELLSTTGDLGIGEIKDFFDDGRIRGTRGITKINLELENYYNTTGDL